MFAVLQIPDLQRVLKYEATQTRWEEKLVMVVVDVEGSILKGSWFPTMFIWTKAFYRNFGQEKCCISQIGGWTLWII